MGLIRKPPALQDASAADSTAEPDRRLHGRHCADLCVALNDRRSAVRRQAARDLAGCPDSAGALVTRLLDEPETSVQAVILSALAAIAKAFGGEVAGEVAIGGLCAALRSPQVALRNGASDTLRHLPGTLVAPHLDTLLDDADSDVRIAAVTMLESLRHPDVEHWLLRVIEHDPHVNVCASAVDLLGELASARAVAPLQRLKRRFADEPYIAFAADLALRRAMDVDDGQHGKDGHGPHE